MNRPLPDGVENCDGTGGPSNAPITGAGLAPLLAEPPKAARGRGLIKEPTRGLHGTLT